MEVVIYILDAPTLVNNIHQLKLWIYSGSIRILVPICTLDGVEQQYKASLVRKEPPKETNKRKSFGKANRKDLTQPLFDINPRTAWEFLMRAKSENGEAGVAFQSPQETFTQWREEEQEVRKVESPQPAPSSFAEALLRKLNINDGTDGNDSTGPPKPRLVARSSDLKSPWKHQGMPQLSSKGIPAAFKAYLSCALWRFYESEVNASDPEIYHVLLEDNILRETAIKLGLPGCSPSELRNALENYRRSQDHRDLEGQLEKDFVNFSSGTGRAQPEPSVPDVSEVENGCSPPKAHDNSLSMNIGRHDSEDDSEDSAQTSEGQNMLSVRQSGPDQDVNHDDLTPKPVSEPENKQNLSQEPLPQVTNFESQTKGESGKAPVQGNIVKPQPAAPAAIELPKSDSTNVRTANGNKEDKVDLTDDSDEEVIVFNPRAKRMSGRLKSPAEASKSRPSTSHGEALAAAMRSRPSTADDQMPYSFEAKKFPRAPMVSTLKPQSPAFTPGQAYVLPTDSGLENSTPFADGAKPSSPQGTSPTPRSPQLKSSPHGQRVSGPHKILSHDNLARQQNEILLQRQQSELIIQRQREAIKRNNKPTVNKPSAKLPPRKVRMEPTENPTVIDPDAFDRSYVVQQPQQASGTNNGKQRHGGKPRRSPKGSPKRPSRVAAEPDVEFVLKSGNPRGSVRGKGKLWVP